jgi:hypothetical protein
MTDRKNKEKIPGDENRLWGAKKPFLTIRTPRSRPHAMAGFIKPNNFGSRFFDHLFSATLQRNATGVPTPAPA